MYIFHTTVHHTFLYIICILYVFSHIEIGTDSPLNHKIFWIVWNDKIIYLYFWINAINACKFCTGRTSQGLIYWCNTIIDSGGHYVSKYVDKWWLLIKTGRNVRFSSFRLADTSRREEEVCSQDDRITDDP